MAIIRVTRMRYKRRARDGVDEGLIFPHLFRLGAAGAHFLPCTEAQCHGATLSYRRYSSNLDGESCFNENANLNIMINECV